MKIVFKALIAYVFLSVFFLNPCFAGFKDLKWSVQELMEQGVPGDIVTLRETPPVPHSALRKDNIR